MGNYQLFGGVEALDVFPNLREGGSVSDIAFVDAVNLDVTPEEWGLGVDEGVELIGNLIVTDDGQGE